MATTTLNGAGYQVLNTAWDSAANGEDIGPVNKLVNGTWKRVRSKAAIARISAGLAAALAATNAATRAQFSRWK